MGGIRTGHVEQLRRSTGAVEGRPGPPRIVALGYLEDDWDELMQQLALEMLLFHYDAARPGRMARELTARRSREKASAESVGIHWISRPG